MFPQTTAATVAAAIAIASVAFVDMNSTAVAAEWQHQKEADKMRGTVMTWDYIESENEANFAFPYNGGSKLAFSIRKKNGKLDGVLIMIHKGQFNCGIYDCTATVKFGEGKVEKIKLNTAADYSMDLLFVANKTAFAKKLAKGGKMIIELPFYQEGPTQFEFNIPELKG